MTRTASPWDLSRPTILSVSGGRTSMYMLQRYLDRHDGQLPEHAVAVFCNTGKEHGKTLDFVQRCSVEWACPITWVEYQDAPKAADRWSVVNHNSCSRAGEPFAAMIRRKNYLPNQIQRICTTELKIHLLSRWAKGAWPYGQGRYVKAIGFRADEGHRVARMQQRCGKGVEPFDPAWPLYDAGIDRAEIRRWWALQSFDLDIEDRWGNCDNCFLKNRAKVAQNIQERPTSADWWIEQQKAIGGFFRSPKRPMHSYVDIKAWALNGDVKPWDQISMTDALDLECACTD
jgi:hypothetical protein